MDLYKIVLNVIYFVHVNSLVVKNSEDLHNDSRIEVVASPDNVFNGVYSECFLHLSYSCLQKKTLLYLKELNNLSEVSVIGDYVKFVRINTTNLSDDDDTNAGSTDELAFLIDKAVDDFFDNHVLKFNALGRDISIPRNMEKFVGRKKRKGGGGGGMMMGGHGGGHDDGGKKKMMMMAMMCMKMKLMMMIPAMMGMMGMMSFKGMMFSMMSFMLSKMMLLMKILEKKGAAGGQGGGGGGGDGSWATGGAGGGAWMPAGGQDFGGGGGGGGGYDANGQWQSRSIAESLDVINKPTVYYRSLINNGEKHSKSYITNDDDIEYNVGIQGFGIEHADFGNKPDISYVKPIVRYNNKIEAVVLKKPVLVYKKSNVDFSNYGHEPNSVIDNIKNKDELNSADLHSRARRSLANLKKDHDNYKNGYITESESNFDIANTIGILNKQHNKTSKNTSRKRRSILDLIQNSYMYWMNRILGINNNRRTNFQKHKVINGVRYVYYPFKVQRPKTPKEVQLTSVVKVADEFKPVITAEDFNKGEIMEGAVESRMHRKKFTKMKDTVNDTMEDNPWQ